jgi:hypothetical protein
MRITKCDDEQIIQRFMWNGDGPITIAARPNITSILTQSFSIYATALWLIAFLGQLCKKN